MNSYSLTEDYYFEFKESPTCENDEVYTKPDKKWHEFPHTYCNGQCPDNSYSIKQEPSEGTLKQEGMCGQTSIVNILEMSCYYNYTTDTVDLFVDDYTPGVRPSTFVNGINKLKDALLESDSTRCPKQKFKHFRSKSGDEFIADLFLLLNQGSGPHMLERINNNGIKVKRSPVALFVQNPGQGFFGAHWVTVVDIENYRNNCTAIVNHWGSQYRVPCDDLKKMAQKGNQYLTVGSFTMIGLTEN